MLFSVSVLQRYLSHLLFPSSSLVELNCLACDLFVAVSVACIQSIPTTTKALGCTCGSANCKHKSSASPVENVVPRSHSDLSGTTSVAVPSKRVRLSPTATQENTSTIRTTPSTTTQLAKGPKPTAQVKENRKIGSVPAANVAVTSSAAGTTKNSKFKSATSPVNISEANGSWQPHIDIETFHQTLTDAHPDLAKKPRTVGGVQIDMWKLWITVNRLGGYACVMKNRNKFTGCGWAAVRDAFKVPRSATSYGYQFRRLYQKYLEAFDRSLSEFNFHLRVAGKSHPES